MKNFVDFTEEVKKAIDREDVAVLENIEDNVELTSTAVRAHALNTYLIYNKKRYKVIQSISIGDTLTVGTNIELAPDLTAELGETNEEVNSLKETLTQQINVNGSKNILPFDLNEIICYNTNGTWAGNVYTYRGVAFTVNSDGTVSATGTPTDGNADIRLFLASSNYEMLGKRVIFNGCPSGGSSATYRMQAFRMGTVDGSSASYYDTGNGVTFTALNDGSGTVGYFNIIIIENTTVSGLVFKPMVRLASDPDDTYEPYAKTNQQLTKETTGLIDNVNSNGCKNILPLSLSFIKKINTSGTWSGNAYTLNNAVFTLTADGDNVTKISVSTTAATTDAANLRLIDRSKTYAIRKGRFAISKGNTADGTTIFFNAYNNNTLVRQIGNAVGSNAYGVCNIDYSDYNTQMIAIGLESGITASNVEFYPMISLLTDYLADPTFAPYAKSNEELTEDVADIPYVALTDNGSSEYTLTEGKMWQTKGVTFLFVAVTCNTVSPISGENHIKIAGIPSKFKQPQFNMYPCIANYKDGSTHIGAQLQIALTGQIAIRGGEAGASYAGLFSY